MKSKATRYVPGILVLLALAGPLLAQQGQNQPIYDPNDPIGRVLPPNIHFLVDVSGSMSCQPNGYSAYNPYYYPKGQCPDFDMLGWNSASKIYITKQAITNLLSRNTLAARWSLWQYIGTDKISREDGWGHIYWDPYYANKVAWSSVKGGYSASGQPTGLYYRVWDPDRWRYIYYDTYLFDSSACCPTSTNVDRPLATIFHKAGTTPATDPDPDQWFKSNIDTGYDNRPNLKLWCDRNFNRTTGTIACGSNSDPFLTEFEAYGNTPIGLSLQSILRYVKGKNLDGGAQKPFYYSPGDDARLTLANTELELDKTYGDCRLNAVLLLTDGVSNCGAGPVESATTLYNTYKIPTYVVGFSMQSAGDKTNLNNIAVAGGTGQAYFADNEAALLAALLKALSNIGSDISGDTEPILGFVPPSARATWPSAMPTDVKLQNVVYKAGVTFSPALRGHLRAFQAITTNADASKITFLTDFSKESPGLLWDSATLLQNVDPAARTIYFIDASGNVQDFTTNNRSKIEDLAGLKPLRLTNAQIDAFINWVRDQDLGTITYSTPAFVGPPNPEAFATTDYQTWSKSEAMVNRCPMILQGANDGMLHCFSGVDGKEVWAIIPYAALHGTTTAPCKLYAELYAAGDAANQGQPNVYGPRVYNRRPHYYYVASSPRVTNMRQAGTKGDWKTMVVFGLGAGGHEVTCLDITSSIWAVGSSGGSFTAPSVVWRYEGESTKPLGETWSVPSTGRFGPVSNDYPHGRWLAVFGSGFNLTPPANQNMGKTVYFLDLETGTKLKQFDLTDTSVTTFGATKNSLVSTVGNCVFSPVTLYDSAYDSDGLIDRAFFGDYTGHLYRINVDGGDVTQSTCTLYFTDKNGTPIYNGPDVAENYISGVGRRTFVSFSEYGCPIDEEAVPQATTRKAGAMYCLLDETCLSGSVTSGDLVVSSGSSSSFALNEAAKGFYFELPSAAEGESAMFRPTLFAAEVNGTMTFWMAGTSYKFFPNAVTGVPCDPKNHTANAGKSVAYVFNLSTGRYFPNGQPSELGVSGTFYGRASAFHKGARGEGWVDVGTGQMKGFNFDSTTNAFSEFGANNSTALKNPTSGVEVINQFWRELR